MPPPSRSTADRLHSAAIHLLRRLRTADTATGLTAPRLSALSVLVFGGPRTITDLARTEQVRLPTMTRLVADMERAGLVRRKPDPTDRRVRWIHPTALGRRLLGQGRARRVRQLEADLARLPAKDRATLEQAVEVMERMARGA